METQNKTLNTSSQVLEGVLINAIRVFACLALVSLIFHFSPEELLERMADFAEHHYLIFVVFCGVLALPATGCTCRAWSRSVPGSGWAGEGPADVSSCADLNFTSGF